ncbi:MAG: sigma-70 family RNA polymerase sigma factor [Candidatus Poribacteria bacterium]
MITVHDTPRTQAPTPSVAPSTHDLNDPELVRQVERVVRAVCVKAGRVELGEDATQEAWAACAELVTRYDPSTGVPLAGFLRPRVYWAALHYCRSNSGAFSIPERMWRSRRSDGEDSLASAIYTRSLHEENDDDEGRTTDRLSQLPQGERRYGVHCGRIEQDAKTWRELEYGQLHAFIERLQPNERDIVRRYGEGYGCAEIARELGVSRQRIHQVLHRAFDKIRLWWDEPNAV